MSNKIIDKLGKAWMVLEKTTIFFSMFLMFIATVAVNFQYKSVVEENKQLKEEYSKLLKASEAKYEKQN